MTDTNRYVRCVDGQIFWLLRKCMAMLIISHKQKCFKGICLFLLFAGLLGTVSAAGDAPPSAAPAAGNEVSVRQPDGTSFILKARGDEWNNWTETVDGYSVQQNCDGFWYYLRGYGESGEAIFDATSADKSPPSDLTKHIVPPGNRRSSSEKPCR